LLGDYIDRGPDSKKVIDYIISLQELGFHIIPLLGNHECMLLDAYSSPDLESKWLSNGGVDTLKSFGIKSLRILDLGYITFFKSLGLFFESGKYLFVHAGFNDELEDPFSDTYHMLWKCRKKYQNPLLLNRVIIHGHCPIAVSRCDEHIKTTPKVINLDTGCVYADKSDFGRLTAYELYTQLIHFV
jgi:serine/threonine protein phosphatase 1